MTVSDGIQLAVAIFTLLGVAVVYAQLQSLNRQSRLQNFAEYTKRYQEIVLRFPEDINSPKFSLDHGRADRDDVMRLMRSYYDLCFEEWYLRDKGLIEDDFWDVWYDGIKTAVSKPAFQLAWQVMKADTNYGSAFSTFIEELMPVERTST